MYTKEVESGKLYWSQVHKEKFWRENVNRFEENDFSLVISLIKFLDSLDVETVAVACYDLGEFCRFYQGGKK
jgi:V-type H+-transporting ATPase subunit H